MLRFTRHLLTAALLPTLLASLSARTDAATLDIQPAAPTSQQEVTARVHFDVNAWCGWVVAASPVIAEYEQIDIWLLPVFLDINCPAIVAPVTVAVPIGTLPAGEYVVKLWRAAYGDQDGSVLASVPLTVTEGPSTVLLLHHGRFEATVRWRSFDGSSGVGKVVPGSSTESGLFWFFGPGNWELLVKLLDACDQNGHFWVLGSGSTSVEFTVDIVDTLTHDTWSYTNPSGQPAGSIFDTQVFPGACHSPP